MRRSKVVIELAGNAALARDLAAGGVFVPGCTLRLADECELVVCGANRRVALPARVVYVDEQRGAGLELIGFSTAMRQQLADLEPGAAPDPADDDLALPTSCHVELSGGEDPELAAPAAPPAPVRDDDLAVPVADDSDDAYRTLPVPTASHATADALDADDWLAVPEVHDDDDDHRTVPVSTGSHTVHQVADDDLALPEWSGPEIAGELVMRRPSTAELGQSDPALTAAAAAADAAFFDATADADPDLQAGDDGAEAVPFEAILDADPDPGEAEAEDAAAVAAGTDPDDDAGRAAGARAPRNVHERLRGLTLAAQIKLAASGELHERIVLERLYGKNVWETLLRNPRLSPSEVSRIARYGSLPRVLLELILANGAWLQVPEVRRSLLSNPRLGTDQSMKVLRLTPKHELRLAAIQTAYPHAVRNAAKQLLRGD